MKKEFFISYIIPCYNIQEYLPRCLDSLSKQAINESPDVEFVLVNDGSPDNCLEIIQDFAAKDSRAVVVDQKNQGVSAARNAGLKVAKGKYVFFLDGDDYLTSDASQIVYDICKKDLVDIAIVNAFMANDGEWNKKISWNVCQNLADGLYSADMFVKSILSLPSSFKVYRRELLEKKRVMFDEDLKVGEVFAFFLHALSYSKTIAISNKRMMYYVIRNNGAMREIDIERDLLITKTIERMEKYAIKSSINFKQYYSYHSAFYRTVRVFTLNKYMRQIDYTKELHDGLKKVFDNDCVRESMKFLAIRQPRLNKDSIYALIQLCVPIRIYYRVFRGLV